MIEIFFATFVFGAFFTFWGYLLYCLFNDDDTPTTLKLPQDTSRQDDGCGNQAD